MIFTSKARKFVMYSFMSFKFDFAMVSLSFQLGGGYLYGLVIGFIVDSIEAIIGVGASFILGKIVSFFPFFRLILFFLEETNSE